MRASGFIPIGEYFHAYYILAQFIFLKKRKCKNSVAKVVILRGAMRH